LPTGRGFVDSSKWRAARPEAKNRLIAVPPSRSKSAAVKTNGAGSVSSKRDRDTFDSWFEYQQAFFRARHLRKRGELVERSFAHCYETGGMRRCTLRGNQNILKRLLIHVGAFNLSLILRKTLGAGTPRELRNRATQLVLRLFWLLTGRYRPHRAAEPRSVRVMAPQNSYRSEKPRCRHTRVFLACATGC
jgi:hypothetical protein